MEHKKFEDIIAAEAEKMLKDIWGKVFPNGKEHDGDSNGKIDQLCICYLLWEMKKNPAIKTVNELYEAYTNRLDDYVTPLIEIMLSDELEVSDVWERFHSLVDEYTIDELKASILKADYEITTHEEVPDSVIDLTDRILSIRKNDRVMDANPMIGKFALRSMKNIGKGEYINLARIDTWAGTTYGSICSAVSGYDNISFTVDTDRNIDKAFVDAFNISGKREAIESENFATELWNDLPREQQETSYLYHWDLCAWSIEMTNYKGKVVAIMNAGGLTNKADMPYRSILCDKGYIEGVIALPDKMFLNTWVNCYLVIFSQNNKTVRFTDARNIYYSERYRGRRVNVFTNEMVDEICSQYNDDSRSTVVKIEDISDTGYNLNPVRYIDIKESSDNTVELGELLYGISRGITLKASEMDKYISNEPSYKKCIVPSQLSNGVMEDYYYYHGELRNQKNDCLYGNILLSKTGSPFKVVMFDIGDAYLVVGNIYILGINSSRVSPEYVKCFLSSKKGQEEMKRLSVGSGTPMLRISDVPKIRIPIYEDKKQQEMNNKAKELLDELKTAHKQLMRDEDEIASMFDEE